MACQHCHNKKVKCFFDNTQGSCNACLRLGLLCVPHKSQQGRRTDIERKLGSSKCGDNVQPSPVGGIDSTGIREPEPLISSTMDTPLDVFCQGKRYIWHVGDTNSLQCETLSSRVCMEKEGVSSYIICTCVSKLPQGANGSLCVFRVKSNTTWHLAVIESFFYIKKDGMDLVHLLEWKGDTSSYGQPSFYNTTNWLDFSGHFSHKSFHLQDIELYYVNKVRGNTFQSLPISDNTRSTKDTGIQCNPDGPDGVPKSIKIPIQRRDIEYLNIDDLRIHSKPFYKKAQLPMQSKKRKFGIQSTLASIWSKPPKKLPPKKSLQCVIVVSKHDGTHLESSDLASLGDAGGLFFFPSPYMESNEQLFYGVSKSRYSSVINKINGVTREEADEILRSHAKTTHTLCNVHSLLPEGTLMDNYQFFTRVFVAGNASPPVSSTNTSTINLPSVDRRVSYVFHPARKFYEYIPLSVGIVDKSLHTISVTNSIIQRIVLCLGKNGLFTNRPCSPHFGSLNFLGPRSLHTVAQPNPSEGDMSSFWYYRLHLSFVWWYLVLKVINLLTSNLITLPRVQFYHLSLLLPFLYPEQFRDGCRDLCRFAILTINFVNTIHRDKNDYLGRDADEAALNALSSLLKCQDDLSFSQFIQVNATISHIEEFGLSAPTTCGYQIVSSDDETTVDVLQFFCGYSLGVCHRIIDGWTHSFLPATYSHYTSAPLYIVEDKVYSKCEHLDIFAWGKGDTKKRY